MAKKIDKIHELWRRGILHWKCHEVQKEMYDVFANAEKYSTLYWLLARQSGKSFLMALIAIEQALKKPNSVIKLLTDTKVHLESIYEPLFKEVLIDCPADLKPDYVRSKFIYYFKNGSQIQLAGADGKHYEKLRGQKSDLVLIDESGFCSDLKYIIMSVLLPTLTHTKGKLVMASTPAKEPDHESWYFIEQSEMQETLITKNIYDNPMLDQQQIDLITERCGGIDSIDFRREYLCQRVRDDNHIVFPEFTQELQDKIIQDNYPKPPFFHTYEAMDVGFKDLTVVLFGYFDFRADKLIIEDEIAVSGKDFQIKSLTKRINEKEEHLWTNFYTNDVQRPKVRVSDIDYIVMQEISLASNNQINFMAARKDDNGAAINKLRTMIASGKIIIHPRCETLIRHLRNCQWSKRSKLSFDRSPDNGHYDAVDALKYMVRHVEYTKNPYPANYKMNLKDTFFVEGKKNYFNSTTQLDVYNKIFNIKRKK